MLKRRPQLPGSGGFTLIESMVVVAISAILASLSYPTFADQLRKGRRVDAIARLAQLQQAEERWRANNTSYGSLAALGVAAQTADGLYRLSVIDARATGYVVLAEAQGGQLRDTACRFMQLSVAGGNTVRNSGADASVGNSAVINDRCWNR
jgi:type IV pilus assembly protein PilE